MTAQHQPEFSLRVGDAWSEWTCMPAQDLQARLDLSFCAGGVAGALAFLAGLMAPAAWKRLRRVAGRVRARCPRRSA